MTINRRTLIAIYALVLVLICDQLSKWWVVTKIMQPPHEEPLTSFLNLVLVWNKGVTFGLLSQLDHRYAHYLLIAVSLVVLALLGRWMLRTSSNLVALALGGIMGGAIGNVVDRVRFGAVVDFLDFYYQNYHWYAFNVADAAIVTGVCLLLLDSLVRAK